MLVLATPSTAETGSSSETDIVLLFSVKGNTANNRSTNKNTRNKAPFIL